LACLRRPDVLGIDRLNPSPIRLNKAIADSGYCARRKADALIAAGKVQVNGQTVVEMGVKVDLSVDRITIDGARLPQTEKFYLAFHKPTGYVTSRQGQGAQKTIYQLIPSAYQSVDPAGRLDQDSSGLLILSNDGHFLNQVTHPRFHWQKVYDIVLDQPLRLEDIQRLEAGILLQPEDKLAKMVAVQPHTTQPTQYHVTLNTGYNRQIRRSIEAVGHRIRTLHRIAFGPIALGTLQSGTFRSLSEAERQALLPDPLPEA
jgi:23S rRNA pseudouridine2605 synthase